MLRDYLAAPIVTDPELGGFRYAPDPKGRAYELPGLWFSAQELQALVVFDRLLESLEPGLLSDHLAPFSKRLAELLHSKRLGSEERRTRRQCWPSPVSGPAGWRTSAGTLSKSVSF